MRIPPFMPQRYKEPFLIGEFYELSWKLYFDYPPEDEKDRILMIESPGPGDIFLGFPFRDVAHSYADLQLEYIYQSDAWQANAKWELKELVRKLMHCMMDTFGSIADMIPGMTYEKSLYIPLENGCGISIDGEFIRWTNGLSSFINQEFNA